MPISQTKGYFENPYYHFLEEPMLFLVAFKMKPPCSSFKTKTNPYFAVKLTERGNHSFLLSIWWMTFLMECVELNWLCKHAKKFRSSQAAILVLNYVNTVFLYEYRQQRKVDTNTCQYFPLTDFYWCFTNTTNAEF